MSFPTRFAWFLVSSIALCAQAADLRGVYVYTNDLSRISKPTANAITSSLGIPGMDGVALVIGWSAIEPAMGQFQWTTLDPWLAQAMTSGKKIELIVTAGEDTPQWLFDTAGAHALSFTISPHSGQTGQCQSLTMAAPWDAAFLAHWDSMLVALAAHLKTIGAYNAITLLRLTGINRTTDELRLPAETPQSTGLACVTDAIATWQQAGYRPSLLLQAWDAITSSFKKSFPDKAFSVAIISVNAFPPIAEDGSVNKQLVNNQAAPLLVLANQKLSGRFVVQYNFLMPGEAANAEVIDSAHTLGSMVAFQTNEYLGQTGGGAGCSEPVTNPTPCTVQTFMALLETGIYPLGVADPLRAQYLEVFQSNANAFPSDILLAHDELVPSKRRRAERH
jgi:hypothetical protein